MNKVLTFGVFDFFHLGHLRLLKQCREHGDYLIVAAQHEDYIVKFKPGAKIMYSTEERVEILEGLKIVDEVVVYEGVCPEFLEKVDFDILALGEDQKSPHFVEAEKWCEEHGKKVVRLRRTRGICSTDIKNEVEKD